MKTIAYVLPTYPMPSQTFIRREIAAMEARGWSVRRYAMRRFDGGLADAADRDEQARTEYVLDAGAAGLGRDLLAELVARPRRAMAAAAAAVRMGRRSEKGVLRHLVYLAEAARLRRRLAGAGARHLHAHFGTNAAAVAMLCRILGGPPYSLTIHGPEEFDAPGPLSLGEKTRHAAFIVAISHFTRSQLCRWCPPGDWGKIHVVRCGLDGIFLATIGAPVPDRPRLVTVGRLAEQKGQLLLVEAAARLVDRVPDFELTIVGDGPMRVEIERAIARHGLGDRVRITGFLDNRGVRRELESARALVLPSFAEGLPVVIMEAMALGRPVIATAIAGIPELVEPGRTGWLVPAGAVEPLVVAMAEALEADPARLDEMGRAGADRAAAQHDADAEAGKLASLIDGPEAAPATAGAGAPIRRLGIVAIGRNEGERLRRCLASCDGLGHAVVYVDSGSTDGSVELARTMGAEVVELDLSIPFTAARARNAGFDRLERIAPGVVAVQFVDGDCEIADGWLDRARAALEARPDVAVVAGRRRERHPDRTVYNRLADLEWDTPIGEAAAVGGDAMIRAGAFRDAGGFDPSIIAAEDDELCLRIRRNGWKVQRLDAEMTVHDMDMTRFGQWWRRSVRCGHAYAEGAARHGTGPERHFVRPLRGAIVWGLLVPVLAIGLAWPSRGLSLALLAGYPVLFWKTERYFRRARGWPAADARVYAVACVLAKFPQVVGASRYGIRRLGGGPSRLIEYKGPAAVVAPPAES